MPVMNFLTTCIFDHGAIAKLGSTLSGFGVTRPMVITDPGIKAVGLLDTVLENLGMEPAAVFADTVANPTEDQAIAVAQLQRVHVHIGLQRTHKRGSAPKGARCLAHLEHANKIGVREDPGRHATGSTKLGSVGGRTS